MNIVVYFIISLLIICVRGESGGAKCAYDIQCGVPAANLVQMRENTKSLTGSCVNKTCVCEDTYSCNRCHGQLLDTGDGVYSTYRQYTYNVNRWLDICTINWGGAQCYMDSQCYNGLCIGGQCVCYYNWVCGDCSMGLYEDILLGATCGKYMPGKGKCQQDTDCNNGVCQNGKCHCQSGYVCAHCNYKNKDIIGGLNCPCDDVDCGEHGVCEHGKCMCTDGYIGIWCETNPCQLLNCGEHGRCDSNNIGVCLCDAGWYGDRCDIEMTGGYECISDSDCNSGIGGFCNLSNGYCQCYEGWTCPQCKTKGTICDEKARVQGGGYCDKNTDCGNFGPDFENPIKIGGECINHQCNCYVGYTCPNCNVIGTSVEIVNKQKVCIATTINDTTTSKISFLFILFCICLIVLIMR